MINDGHDLSLDHIRRSQPAVKLTRLENFMNCVSEQGTSGLLWTVFEGAPFSARRIASFSKAEDARRYVAAHFEIEERRKVMADIVRVMGNGCDGMAGEKITSAVSELRKSNAELYALVEAYLCTPSTEPKLGGNYKALVAWFVRHKRPDGTEPLPVSPEQDNQPDFGQSPYQ